MPIIDITYSSKVSAHTRQVLVDRLPEIVSQAIACEEEPYDGDLQPGDVLIRFHQTTLLDRFDIDLLIQIHSKWFEDRARDRQRRVALIREQIQQTLSNPLQIGALQIGVYLALPVAAWAQTSDDAD